MPPFPAASERACRGYHSSKRTELASELFPGLDSESACKRLVGLILSNGELLSRMTRLGWRRNEEGYSIPQVRTILEFIKNNPDKIKDL